ncbi:MAG: cytidylate kinase-like family protein [Eubacterium sp.]|nr:cytidylate kinase-like family protein [Eubacterium sp.]
MNTIITIGRQFGSGGHDIGVMLSKELNIPLYDKELLEQAAKESGMAKEIIEHQDESKSGSFLFSLVMDSYSTGNNSGTFIHEMPLSQKVFLAQFDAIQNLAEQGPCIFVGRCADYVLDRDPRLLSVFIHAEEEFRAGRIAAAYDLSIGKAKERMIKLDKGRQSYYNYNTNKRWGACESYDLTINTARVGIKGAVEIIKNAILAKENFQA